MEIRYPGMVDEGKLTQTPLGRALERKRAEIQPKKFANLTKAKVSPARSSPARQLASSPARQLASSPATCRTAIDGRTFRSPAAARPYPSAQIEKIFKAHAADNPVLNEKLDEFLTLAAVVRCRAICRRHAMPPRAESLTYAQKAAANAVS